MAITITTEPVKNAANTQPAFEAQKGKGRPKGRLNKNTTALKDMILKALDQAGGVDYLTSQASQNPGPFMTLVGKVLPLDVKADVSVNSGELVVTIKRPVVDG